MTASARDVQRQLGLLGLVTDDPGMSAAGKGVIDEANSKDQSDRQQAALAQQMAWKEQVEKDKDVRQQRQIDAQEARADARMSTALGRWTLKKIPTPDGFKYVQMNNLTGEIKDPPVNLDQNTSVTPKAKQDAQALENAASRVEQLMQSATPEMFNPGRDLAAQGASHIPLVGPVAANYAKNSFSPEHTAFLVQETLANQAVRKAYEGLGGTDESRRQMADAYPYTPGTTYQQFVNRAGPFIAQLRSQAAGIRGANYNPSTGAGGSPPPTMQGAAPGGQAGGATQSGPVYERHNGKLVRVQ